jgi:cardiolipin synthase A/B
MISALPQAAFRPAAHGLLLAANCPVADVRTPSWPGLRRLLVRSLGGFALLQLLVIGLLTLVDTRRKRRRQGDVSEAELAPVRVADSEVRLYTQGTELYAAMLDAIRRAKRRILFETYIWHDDQFGQKFKHALEAAAVRGV